MVAGFIEFLKDFTVVIGTISGLVTITTGLITIMKYVKERKSENRPKENIDRKKRFTRSVFSTIAIISLVIFIFMATVLIALVLSLPDKSDKRTDKTKVEPPVYSPPPVIEINEEIVKLVKEARNMKDAYPAGSLDKFEQAYKLLSKTQKRKTFIDSIGGYMVPSTQINYYDDYFKSLNY